MRPIHSAQNIRAAEEAFFAAHPDVDLMGLAAGQVAAAALTMLGAGEQVLVVAGPGNNGGDALFAAAAIANSGRRVRLWLAAGQAHAAGLAAAEAAGCVPVSASSAMEWLHLADLVVDGVTGIGGRGGLTPEVAAFAAACRDTGTPVLSVDLPSGLAADSHTVGESFHATVTITFAAEKMCHVGRPAADRCGRVRIADIGLELPDTDLWQAETSDVARWWPIPDSGSDKYRRGVVGLDTGLADYPGAAVLTALGAVYSGAGLVRYLGPSREYVLHAAPSVVCSPGRVQAIVLGSGWGKPDEARVAAAAERGVPLVLDAEALLTLPGQLPAGSLLTPHAGELARLLGVERDQVTADPVGHVQRAATRHGVYVLLKGASQYVAAPDGRTTLAVPGPAWTAQAGSGDVLAGICGTLLAAGIPAGRAAIMAASIQAITAADNPGPYPPDALARLMPETIADLAQL